MYIIILYTGDEYNVFAPSLPKVVRIKSYCFDLYRTYTLLYRYQKLKINVYRVIFFMVLNYYINTDKKYFNGLEKFFPHSCWSH